MFNKKSLYILILLLLLSSCKDNKKVVVIYTSVDQVYSSKIFKDFENKTGIKVLAVYDTEASKAIGLEKRILIERDRPKADIFWNSEPMRTQNLANKGLFKSVNYIDLSKYKSNNYYDPAHRWFGIGERSRVIIINKNLVKQNSKRLDDILVPKYKRKIAISNPYIGTASTHFAALYCKYGKDKFEKLIKKLENLDIEFLSGNSVVKDAVADGKYYIGIVDSDDAKSAIRAGLPVRTIYYNQNSDGVFKIFGTVAILKKAPHSKEAKKFLLYLLSKNTERKLIKIGAVNFSVFKDINNSDNIKGWTLNPKDLDVCFKNSIKLLKTIY